MIGWFVGLLCLHNRPEVAFDSHIGMIINGRHAAVQINIIAHHCPQLLGQCTDMLQALIQAHVLKIARELVVMKDSWDVHRVSVSTEC